MFRVADGAIVAGSPTERIAHNEFLASREEYGDFELRLKARLTGKGQNAGVQFRSQRVPNHFEMIGYQCDMGAHAGQTNLGSGCTTSRGGESFWPRRRRTSSRASSKSRRLERSGDPLRGSASPNLGERVQTVDYTETGRQHPPHGQTGPANPWRANQLWRRIRTIRIQSIGGDR